MTHDMLCRSELCEVRRRWQSMGDLRSRWVTSVATAFTALLLKCHTLLHFFVMIINRTNANGITFPTLELAASASALL